ncbi:TonB-dependent receptor [Sphingomonas profundi]|uniref:TonB-dependent receptor n=1 Tax=Alterirhizorhabdus profundi TaxID=2681549 RepID=UPI0012E96160|nr:TonB-dependent receptor [Sphingomonas profundi]
MRRSLFLGGVALAALSGPALAEEAPAGSTYHAAPPAEIIVTAPFQRDRADVLSGVAILQGADLTQALRPTIGETLARTPGVSATSFGPNASRPVLRGLQGERVRVLTDGIGSIDVSNTSVDHAVVIDPLLADRVEVLRGPAALLYGSAAIGGVVNVIDKRIPRAVPDEPIHIDAIASYGSAADERSIAGAADVPVGKMIVLHADGSYLKTDDLRIGGHVLSRQARAEALASAAAAPDDEIDFAASAALKNRLPNSAGETWTAGVGAAIITDTGNFGIAYSHYDSLYGVPIRYATAPGQEQEAPRLDLKQNRIDARTEVQTGGGILQTIRGRFGYASYRHFELEEDGSIGTAFYNKGLEGRLELVQADHGAWKGASGVQYFSRDFNVVGEEAFLPRNDTRQIGIFTLQQLDFGRLKLEAGGRYEHSSLQGKPTVDQPQFADTRRSFDAFSASAGASYGLGGQWRLGVNLSRTERAPSAEELFANGPHAGTEAFEIGDPDFRKERSYGVEAVLRGRGDGYTFEASAYHNWFSNFIYEDRTGAIEDGLPVYQGRQADARYYGFEAQGSLDLAKVGAVTLRADGLADYVHAQIKSVGPAPRIPPLRLLGGIGATSPKIDGRVEVEWTDDQNRLSALETETDGFTLVNATIALRPWGAERPLSFAFSANNIFDVNARRHASFLKDFAPLAGRDFRITARASF